MNKISKIISVLFGLGLFFVATFSTFAQARIVEAPELPDDIFVNEPAYEELKRCVPDPPLNNIRICYDGFYKNAKKVETKNEYDFFLNEICGFFKSTRYDGSFKDNYSGEAICLVHLAIIKDDISVCNDGATPGSKYECEIKYYTINKKVVSEEEVKRIGEGCKNANETDSCAIMIAQLCSEYDYNVCDEFDYKITSNPGFILSQRFQPEPEPEIIEDCKDQNCVNKMLYGVAEVNKKAECEKLTSDNLQNYCLSTLRTKNEETRGASYLARSNNAFLVILYLLVFFGIHFAKRKINSRKLKSILTVFQIFLIYALVIRFAFLIASIFWPTGRGLFDATGEPGSKFTEILSIATLHTLIVQGVVTELLKIKLLTIAYLIHDLAIGIIFSLLLGALPISQTAKKTFAHVIFWSITIILNIFLFFLFGAALG